MRTLVVAYEYPWPPTSGFRLRLLTMLRALCKGAPTDLFSITPNGGADLDEPDPTFGLENVCRVPVRPGGARLGGLAQPLLPAAIALGDRRRVSRALARFTTGAYDLVSYYDVRAWVFAGTPDLAPMVIDFDDLEHHKIWSRLSIGSADGIPDPAAAGPARDHLARALEKNPHPGLLRGRGPSLGPAVPQRRPGPPERFSAAKSMRTAPPRAARGGWPSCPTAYARPNRPVGRSAIASPPVILFQGTLRYQPNADAAGWLVGRIAPALCELVPDARIRLVGRPGRHQADLDHPPETTVVGPVPEILTELSQADVVVVPVRFGSGTRVKIIEAFSHKIPVVSTTLGAEGLGVENGRHLLLADTTAELAAACARLLTEPDLRRRLVDAARDLYLESFESEVAEAQVTAIAQAVVGQGVVEAP